MSKPQRTPKPIAQRVKETAERHQARGERQIKVWVHADYPEDAKAIRDLAKLLLAKRTAKTVQTVN